MRVWCDLRAFFNLCAEFFIAIAFGKKKQAQNTQPVIIKYKIVAPRTRAVPQSGLVKRNSWLIYKVLVLWYPSRGGNASQIDEEIKIALVSQSVQIGIRVRSSTCVF